MQGLGAAIMLPAALSIVMNMFEEGAERNGYRPKSPSTAPPRRVRQPVEPRTPPRKSTMMSDSSGSTRGLASPSGRPEAPSALSPFAHRDSREEPTPVPPADPHPDMTPRRPAAPNLAARAARWSAGRWKMATGAWLAVVVMAALLGAVVGTVKLTDAEQATGETARGSQILAHAGFERPASESVIVQSRSLTAADPGFRATVADVTRALRGRPEATDVRSRYAAGASGQISRDRHSALVLFDMRGEATSADKRVTPVLHAVATVARASTADRRRVRRGQRRARAQRHHRQGLRQRGEVVGADHVRDPANRVRGVRGGRRAGAAGVLGPGGADLRSHGADRDGRHAVRRLEDLHLDRGRHDDRGPPGMVGPLTVLPAVLAKLEDRVDRGVIAVLAASIAWLVRPLRWRPAVLYRLAERRTLLQRFKVPARRVARVGLRAAPGAALPGAGRARRHGAARRARAADARDAHQALRFSDLPKRLQIVQTYDRIQHALPGRPDTRPGGRQGARRRRPRGARRDRVAASATLWPQVSCSSRSRRSSTPTARSRASQIPLAGDGEDAASVHALRSCANR